MKKVDIEIITYNTTPHPLIFLFFHSYTFSPVFYISLQYKRSDHNRNKVKSQL